MKAIFLLALLTLGAVTADDFAKDDSGDISMMSSDPTTPPSSERSTTSGPSITSSGSTTTGPPLTDSDLRIPEEYESGRSYYYSYQAQILTGVPESSNTYSGLRLQCRVRFVVLAKRRVHMRFDRISFLKTNRILPVQRPTHILPKYLFQRLPSQKDQALIERMLQLPVSFVWTRNGWVKEIRVSKLDTFWSINIKKGFMTMLNLNLRVDPKDVLQGNGVFKRTKYFEDGIDGQCKANYEYRRFPYDLSNRQNANRRVITISKIRDLTDCKAKPWFAHTLFLPEKCSQSRRPVSTQAETIYRVTVSRSRFFLTDIRTTSQYSFTERDIRDGSIKSFVTQRCRYIGRSRRVEELLKQKDSKSQPEGLVISIMNPEMAKRKRDDPMMLAATTLQAIQIVKNYRQDKLEMYDSIRKFIELVRRLSKNDIKKLLTQVERDSEVRKLDYKEILYEIIPKAATKEVVLALLDKIKSRQLSDDLGAMVISRLGGMSFVSSEYMIKQMMNVALSIRSPKQKETYKALVLIIGKLINTRNTMPIPGERQRSNKILTHTEIKVFYKRLFKESNTVLGRELKTIVIISSLGNAGIRPCLDLIEPFLKPRHKDQKLIPRAVRVAATIALQGSAKLESKRVRKLALEIFYDEREIEELRLNAYEAFMATEPGLADLKLITRQLAREPVRQVRSFVATHLRLLSAAAKERCLAPLALNASRLLREVDPEIEKAQGLQFSRIIGLGLPLRESVGIALANVKFTSQGFLPRQLSLGALTKLFGLNIDLGAIGLRADDAQRLLDRLLGPDGTLRTSKTYTQLLKAVTGRSKVDTDFLGAIRLYKGIYGIDGLTEDATRALKKGLIPVTKEFYRFATRGGPLSRQGEILSYVDGITLHATTIGVPFTLNHTVGAHIKISARAVVRPKLFSKEATVALHIKGGASFRHQIYGGPDMTIVRSFVSAMHQVHVPRIRSPITIKLGWINQRPKRDQLLFRINVERPQKDRKVLQYDGQLQSALVYRTQPRRLDIIDIEHRSLKTPVKQQTSGISSEQLGLGLEVRYRVLNFTGIRQKLAVPYYSPRELQLVIKRDQSVGADKGIDFQYRLYRKRTDLLTSIGDIRPIDEEFQGKDNVVMFDSNSDSNKKPSDVVSSKHDTLFTEGDDQIKESDDSDKPMSDDLPYSPLNMTAEQRKDFYAEHRRLKAFLGQLVVKLDTMKNDGRPRINTLTKKYISRGQIYLAVLKQNKGVSYSVLVQRRLPKSFPMPIIRTYYASGLVLLNNAIRQAKFDERQPLKTIRDIKAIFLLHLRRDKKLIASLTTKLSMGKQWRTNVERIIRRSDKELPVFPDIKRCQRDLKRRRFGTPACYQAWKDINALTETQSQLSITPDAPSWLKQYPVALFNYMRFTQSSALRFSKYEEPNSKILRVACNFELSPFNQRLVSGYMRILRFCDHYVNAYLFVSRRNSIAQSPLYGLVSNAFVDLYPAKCELVRRGPRLSWRTFDRVDREAISQLAYKAGRAVLVQDLKRRLLISEQKSVHHRVIQIRLRKVEHHVLIVVNEKSRRKFPQVFYNGKVRRLPFKLYNKRRQLVLGVFRDATARSRDSLTAVMPQIGCSVRTNPAVSTEVRLTPFLFSTVRGICGDFSAEKRDDSKGPLCRAVYPKARSFLQRYTTILVSQPSLPQLEKMPPMTNFMRTAQCPNRRYYPLFR